MPGSLVTDCSQLMCRSRCASWIVCDEISTSWAWLHRVISRSRIGRSFQGSLFLRQYFSTTADADEEATASFCWPPANRTVSYSGILAVHVICSRKFCLKKHAKMIQIKTLMTYIFFYIKLDRFSRTELRSHYMCICTEGTISAGDCPPVEE